MKYTYNSTGHELKITNIVDSKGVFVVDESGNRFMDLESGVWCVPIGHKNESVNSAVKRQIDSLMHAGFCYSNEILEESSKSVLDITDFKNGKCAYLCSGSEAIEITRQISRHLTGQKKSMTLHDSYLGSYSSVTERDKDWYIFDWEKCNKCSKNDTCDSFCTLFKDIPEDISDFIFEPGSSSGFVRFPPKALVQNIVKIIKKNSGKVIVNEVTTGVGRTAKWFGFQHYDIKPDLIAIGKGIGNGYPVSVAVINEKIVNELEAKPFRYAQSHQNDPLGASVVKEVISFINSNDLIASGEQKGLKFLQQLKSLVDNKIVLNVRGRGMMFGMDMVNQAVADSIHSDLIEKGYIIGLRGALLRIDPPLIITESELDGFIKTFKDVLQSKY